MRKLDSTDWTREQLLEACLAMAETREYMKASGLDKISHVDWPDSPGGPPVIRPGAEIMPDAWQDRIAEYREFLSEYLSKDYKPKEVRISGHSGGGFTLKPEKGNG
jgi:hypothetical protein